jgi:hypothetical protein
MQGYCFGIGEYSFYKKPYLCVHGMTSMKNNPVFFIAVFIFCLINSDACSQVTTVASARNAYICALHERSMHRIISALILQHLTVVVRKKI